MRENCARVAAIAAKTGLFGPLFLLLAALLLRVFGHAAELEFTWHDGTLYITGRRAPEAARARRPPRNTRTPSTQRPDSARAPAHTPRTDTPRPVERPPKSARKPQKPAPRTCTLFVTLTK
jgi:hypothetical protein